MKFLMISMLALFVLISGCWNIKPADAHAKKNEINTPNLATKNFQIDFLEEIHTLLKQKASTYLNSYLAELAQTNKYTAYAKEFTDAFNAEDTDEKIILIKQILDIRSDKGFETEDFYTVRNVNFIKKLKHKLHHLQYESAHEIRQLRLYYLCKQFRESAVNHAAVKGKPLSRLIPITEENVGNILQQIDGVQTNQTISIDIYDFGRRLYENVKIAGAEVIDDYLINIRKLLEEVIDDKSEQQEHTVRLSKFLNEINDIIAITDFYEKRQKLYAYLKSHLSEDYEKFRTTEHAKEDLAEIMKRLRERGMDLFISFLLSNFEFLEHLHAEWYKLLPQVPQDNVGVSFEPDAQLIFDIHKSYVEFKVDSENVNKYDAYLDKVKLLHTKTANSTENVHVYEMLHNASQNVGSVTLNMIRDKCDEV